MTRTASKKARLDRLEASRAVERRGSLADRLAAARARAQSMPSQTAGERLERYQRLVEEHPHSVIAARLLRAAIRMKE